LRASERKDGSWDVKLHGKKKRVSSHRLKTDAVKHGRRLAKQSALGQAKIFSQKWKVQASHKHE